MKIIPFSLSHSQGKEYNTTNSNDEQLIRSIMNHEEAALRAVYKELYQKIRKMVYTFRNITLDPEDIFQEGLTRSVMNIREGKFRGESSFCTYLNSICRNICLKELEHQKTIAIDKRDFIQEEYGTDFGLLQQVLAIRGKLEEKCRDIIDLRFDLAENPSNPSEQTMTPGFEEIAGKLGLTPDNARQRFKRCLDKLKELIKKNPDLKNYQP